MLGGFMMSLIKKNKEIIMYLIFGVLTTLVNIVTYTISTRIFNIDVYSSNVIAWLVSVLFAYLTNRKYVFNSKAKSIKEISKEIFSFYICRVATFLIDMLMMYLMVDMMKIDDLISKIVVNVVVIILNYIFSKLIIFRKNTKE
jgi:putative flippase GtrA